jgi:hypothetical protein
VIKVQQLVSIQLTKNEALWLVTYVTESIMHKKRCFKKNTLVLQWGIQHSRPKPHADYAQIIYFIIV